LKLTGKLIIFKYRKQLNQYNRKTKKHMINLKKSLKSQNNIVRYNASVSLKNQLREINAILASVKTPLAFRAHYVKNGVNGVAQLIEKLMEKRGAINALGAELGKLRSIALVQSVFVSDIIADIRKEFGFDRYPDATIYQYLSVKMNQGEKGSKKVATIILSNVEDKNRKAKNERPRRKFYLVAKN